MKKRIQIIVINPTSENKPLLQEITLKSIGKLREKSAKSCIFSYNQEEIIDVTDRQDEAKKLNKFIASCKECDYYFVITNGSEVPKNFEELLTPYIKDEESKVVYMPLVELAWYIGEDKEISSKGFLNSCLWKSYMTEEVGILDEKLARRQVDTTIFGCLIPRSLFETFKFNEDLKYFYQFDFLNQITHEKIEVVGIPKCSVFLAYDYELKETSQEEKREEFKLVSQPTPVNV